MSEGEGPTQAFEFAISAVSTFHSTYLEDLAIYSAAGIRGIGLWEYKLPRGRDEEMAERLLENRLKATFCFPNVKGVLPGDGFDVRFSQPTDRKMRIDMLCEGIRRLAMYDPVAVICLTGPLNQIDRAQGRTWVVEGLKQAADVAGEVGVRLAIEVFSPGPTASLVSTIPEALELIEDMRATNVDVLIDTWHVSDLVRTLDDVQRYGDRIVGVQISDRPAKVRGGMDRVLPGDGEMDLVSILKALRRSAFSGWYELEIFSDDGTFGNTYPGSLWRMEASVLVSSARDRFVQLWDASNPYD